MKLLIIYLVIVNVAGLLFMLADKIKAKRGAWRISEATLMTVAAIGGSFGSFLGMQLFRHKTRHAKFYIGVPVLMVAHTIIFGWLISNML